MASIGHQLTRSGSRLWPRSSEGYPRLRAFRAMVALPAWAALRGPDLSTLVAAPDRPGTANVICDIVDLDGRVLVVEPRRAGARVVPAS